MNRQIERAIRKRTGYKGVKVSARGGVCRFYSDEDQEIDMITWDAVYVPRLNCMTPQEWAIEFSEMLELFEDK